MEEKSKKLVAVGGLLLFLVLLIFYNCLQYGFKGGFVMFFSNIGKYIFWLVLISIAVAVIYFLFLYEQKINPTTETMRNIIKECKLNRPDKKLLECIWCKGDKNHHPIKLGKIVGYSRRQSFKLVPLDIKTQEINEEDKQKEIDEAVKKKIGEIGKKEEYQIEKETIIQNGKNIEYYNIRYKQEEDIFYVKSKFLKKIIIRCPPQLHDELLGDVNLYAVGLVKHSLYYYPNSVHLDFDFIDNTIYHEGERYTQLWFIDAIVTILRKASGLTREEQIESSTGKKGIEMVREVKK